MKVKGMSERAACKAVGLARSSCRRLPLAQTPQDPNVDLRAWLRRMRRSIRVMGSGGRGRRYGGTRNGW